LFTAELSSCTCGNLDELADDWRVVISSELGNLASLIFKTVGVLDCLALVLSLLGFA
jgi:hypothetical protein